MWGRVLIKQCIVTGRSPESPDPDDPPQMQVRRRAGGSRRPASDRVTLKRDEQVSIGWTLNLSRGGVRIVVEDSIELLGEYEVVFGEDDSNPRPVRVAWIQDEAGGQIAGLQFLDVEGTIPPQDPPDGDI